METVNYNNEFFVKKKKPIHLLEKKRAFNKVLLGAPFLFEKC